MDDSNLPPNHSVFYSRAYLYDLAFRFKELDRENATLMGLYEGINGRPARSFLDIAAGPASNAIAIASRYAIEVHALDSSAEMVEYGREQAKRKGVLLNYQRGDMRDFQLPVRVDIAAIFMASTGYLLRNDDMVSHLRAVSRSLEPNGIYVMEMTHPRDIFAIGSSTKQEWTVEHEGCTVGIQWGRPDDSFDPIEQVRNVTACVTYSSGADSSTIREQCPQRDFTYQEMRALVELSGAFDWITTLGDWDTSVPCDNKERAWRMIPVLKRRG
jgi:ubiquinone/menaquinone biosynthesis C-methylase UbiE